MPVLSTVLKNSDILLFSLPVAIPLALGVGCNVMEHSDKRVLQAIGWLGTRVCVILVVLTGVTLVVWSLAKTMFVHGLNAITCRRIESLKHWAEYFDIQNSIIMAGLSFAATGLLACNIRQIFSGLIGGGAGLPNMATQITQRLTQILQNPVIATQLTDIGLPPAQLVQQLQQFNAGGGGGLGGLAGMMMGGAGGLAGMMGGGGGMGGMPPPPGGPHAPPPGGHGHGHPPGPPPPFMNLLQNPAVQQQFQQMLAHPEQLPPELQALLGGGTGHVPMGHHHPGNHHAGGPSMPPGGPDEDPALQAALAASLQH